jgi:hypothetical protein
MLPAKLLRTMSCHVMQDDRWLGLPFIACCRQHEPCCYPENAVLACAALLPGLLSPEHLTCSPLLAERSASSFADWCCSIVRQIAAGAGGSRQPSIYSTTISSSSSGTSSSGSSSSSSRGPAGTTAQQKQQKQQP